MYDRARIRAEMEEQRCLIEQQHVEILRQRRHLEVQRRLTEYLETELDALRLALLTSVPAAERQPRDGDGPRAEPPSSAAAAGRDVNNKPIPAGQDLA